MNRYKKELYKKLVHSAKKRQLLARQKRIKVNQLRESLKEQTKIELQHLHGWKVEETENLNNDLFLVQRTSDAVFMACLPSKGYFTWESLSKLTENSNGEAIVCAKDEDTTSVYYKVTKALTSPVEFGTTENLINDKDSASTMTAEATPETEN